LGTDRAFEISLFAQNGVHLCGFLATKFFILFSLSKDRTARWREKSLSIYIYALAPTAAKGSGDLSFKAAFGPVHSSIRQGSATDLAHQRPHDTRPEGLFGYLGHVLRQFRTHVKLFAQPKNRLKKPILLARSRSRPSSARNFKSGSRD